MMIAPDLLHEFELGIAKRIITHAMRILAAYGNGALQTLNQR